MYNFIEVKPNDIDNFSKEHLKGHIFQTSGWGKVKKDWIPKYIAGYDSNNNNMILSCMMILRKIPKMTYYIGYIPRGFVADYNNKDLLIEFTEYLREFSKSNKVAFITIDPDIHLKEDEKLIYNSEKISGFLQSIGYNHKDSVNFEGIQPNFVFRLDLPTSEDKEAAKKKVFKNFSSKTRYNIRVAEERGLSYETYDKSNITDEVLEEFHKIMVVTGKRDNFITRNKEYFKEMINDLFPFSRLYMIKYSYAKDLERLTEKLKKQQDANSRAVIKIEEIKKELLGDITEDKLEKLNKKLQDNENKLKESERQIEGFKNRMEDIKPYEGQEFYISGALYLYYGGKAWYLYGASDDVLRDAMPNFLMQYAMINDSIDLGCYLYDFRGVSGDLNPENPLYGLYKFKKGFNGKFVEFIGEFDLVIKKPIYNAFKYVFPRFKEIRSKLRNKK
ncbi:peptidoglycan bridge formation glycyltransferase FemA/FemB family protein [Clostridium algidicarnis]|uniref:peptidoglycan bridge formation glycyltransferase FemA/FemB family protein n=1 Tax=Clostridium algidicarnis TaxID=37659 RepID=UPI000495F0AA|nr:peptidoglycan bridge formation glycyltransferase FemA/FemB family protein [Clostridium algidicarnis]